jgi:hypothetical protein
MPLDRDAVIQAVVKQHGILLGKDDPILSFLAVHDVIIGEYSEKMTAAVEKLQEHLELVTDRHHSQSKELAETIVGKAVVQIRQEGKDIQEGLRSMLEAERQKHQSSMAMLAHEAEQSSKRAHIAMWAALGFSVLSVIAAAIIVAV